MGSAGSKVGKQYSEEGLQEGSVPSTPILTPKVMKVQELDPRSPSMHIARTPLQLPSMSESLEEPNGDSINIVNDETPVRNKTILLGIDPRSPTVDFKRTPIVINVEEDLPKKIRNKNLDKVKASAIIIKSAYTPDKSIPFEKSSSNVVPPKLLESSPIRSKTDVNKRKSFVGLLETNIDFTETDLDVVILEKSKIKEKLLNEGGSPQKSYICVLQKEIIDPRSPTNDFIRTPLQLAKKIGEIELNDEEPDSIIEVEPKCHEIIEKSTRIIGKSHENILENLETENVPEIIKSIDIVNTEVNINEELVLASEDNVVLETERDVICENENKMAVENDVELEEEHIIVKTVGEVEIPKETKSAPVTPPVANIKEKTISVASPIMNKTKSAPVTPPEVNLTADVKELDKKLTNLIYQDEDVVVCPRIVTLKEYRNRSPLRNCNLNEPEKKKSAQKLKVSDKPRKSDFAVSKIPVFKEKNKKSVIQCENTPPRNMDKKKVKAKKSHWDNTNTTLII